MKTRINTPFPLAAFAGLLFVFLLAESCGNSPTPRPYGYFRVDLPAATYVPSHLQGYPFSFDVAKSAVVEPRVVSGEKFWLDIHYPTLNANVYCSYKPVRSDLFRLVEDTRNIVYKHLVRANDIAEIPFENPKKKVYGILYELSGNTASPVQFILTDSANHFFRGAVYFESVPNSDSIAPMARYVQEDVMRLMESFEWK